MKTVRCNKKSIEIEVSSRTTSIPVTYFSYLDKYIKYWTVWRQEWIITLRPNDTVYLHNRLVWGFKKKQQIKETNAYKKKNKEKMDNYNKEYREKNREIINEKSRNRMKKNRDEKSLNLIDNKRQCEIW